MLYGAHVSIGGGIAEAIPRAREFRCDAIQIFTQNARQWKPTDHAAADLAAFGPRAAKAGVRAIVCHAIYFINLASADDEIYGKSVEALAGTVRVAAAIGGDVCFHVGSHRGQGLAATMPRILRGLEPALAALGDDRWLLLENSAGAGDTIGRDVSELAAVIHASGHPRLGLCLDTCHLYVSGVDVREPAVVDTLVGEIDGSVGIERLRALHVNDSAAPLGSNRDRHAPMGAGEIGRRLGVFLSHPALQSLPAILETPGAEDERGPGRGEVRRLKQLHRSGLRAREAAAAG